MLIGSCTACIQNQSPPYAVKLRLEAILAANYLTITQHYLFIHVIEITIMNKKIECDQTVDTHICLLITSVRNETLPY